MASSDRRFRQILRDYEPLTFEALGSQAQRFRLPITYVLKNRTRFQLVLGTALSYFPTGPVTAVDLGTFPGSFLRLLRRFFPPERCHLIGVGLMISEEFSRAMKDDCDAEIYRVNLDPRNEQIRQKGYPTRIPLEDGKVDLAFALEVVEHLVSPSHLLAEAFRILAPKGHLFITTPNVSRIGSVFKLLIGRSNFDRLIPVDYDCPDDEWRPHFREYTLAEIEHLLEGVGFEVVESCHFLGHDTRYGLKSCTQRIVDFLKLPFYAIPHLRTNLLLVGRKPGGDSS